MKNKSTHFLFNGKKIVVSPDIWSTINFLQEIDKEILEMLGTNSSARTKLIVLFANLEVLLRLNFAYENKVDDGEKIRQLSMNQQFWEKFYSDFCLNQDNKWVQKNKKRAQHITVTDLRYLRNSLTHFFSIDKDLQVADKCLDKKSREIEKETSYKARFISPEDLYEIIKGTAMLMIKKWNNDCLDNINKKPNEFKNRILAVNKLVKASGPIIIKGNQINI